MARLTAAFSLNGEMTTRIPPAFFSAIGRQAFIDLLMRRNGITTPQETQRYSDGSSRRCRAALGKHATARGGSPVPGSKLSP